MGIITYKYRITNAAAMIAQWDEDRPIDVEQKVSDEAMFLLSVMPRGTRYLGHERMSRIDLYHSYLLKFDHPGFEDGSKVETDYVREFYVEHGTNGDSIRQYNLFIGLTYFKPNGCPRYDNYPGSYGRNNNTTNNTSLRQLFRDSELESDSDSDTLGLGNLAEEANRLAANRSATNITQGSAMVVEDLSSRFVAKLNAAAAFNIQKVKSTSLSGKYRREDGSEGQYVTKYHSVTILPSRGHTEDDAMNVLARDIEKVHSRFGVVGALCVCSSLNLAVVDLEIPKAVFSFICIPKESSEAYDRMFLDTETTAIREGAAGRTL